MTKTTTDTAFMQDSLVSRNLKLFRKLFGISQEQLGQMAGMERSYVGKIERAESSPTVSKLSTIAKALGIPLCLFFCTGQEDNKGSLPANSSLINAIAGLLSAQHETDNTSQDETTFIVTVRGDEAIWQPLTANNATTVIARALEALDSSTSTGNGNVLEKADITHVVSGSKKPVKPVMEKNFRTL